MRARKGVRFRYFHTTERRYFSTRFYLPFLALFLIACNSSNSNAEHIKVFVTRLTLQGVAADWIKINNAYSHCEHIFNQHIAVDLKLISYEDRTFNPESLVQTHLFWSVYKSWPFSDNSQIWLVVTPFFSGGYAGLGTLSSYKNPDLHPLAMVWDIDRYSYKMMGEVMAHEICHNVGYTHANGYEFSNSGIQAVHEYLSSLNRKKIRAARENYLAAREHGTRKEAARWKRIWRLRRQKLFRL